MALNVSTTCRVSVEDVAWQAPAGNEKSLGAKRALAVNVAWQAPTGNEKKRWAERTLVANAIETQSKSTCRKNATRTPRGH